MKKIAVLAQKEFYGYFSNPVYWIFLVIFVMLSSVMTFQTGAFFERNQADLQSFFLFVPWLYVFIVPAVSMPMWAQERHSGTIELLMTLPFKSIELVLGKFLAAWAFIGLALALDFPLWISVNYLGQPDNGVILCAFIASFLIAGVFLALGSCMSALTKSQTLAFVLTVFGCIILMIIGSDALLNIVSSMFSSGVNDKLLSVIRSFSFLEHYISLIRGVADLKDILFFISFCGLFLFASLIIIDYKKAS